MWRPNPSSVGYRRVCDSESDRCLSSESETLSLRVFLDAIESMVSAGTTPDHATMLRAAQSIAVDEETVDDVVDTGHGAVDRRCSSRSGMDHHAGIVGLMLDGLVSGLTEPF